MRPLTSIDGAILSFTPVVASMINDCKFIVYLRFKDEEKGFIFDSVAVHELIDINIGSEIHPLQINPDLHGPFSMTMI